METRQLRYFVALAEELHFARAALRVGIEQSPLSKAITEMERHLGVQLFVRTRRSTRLTVEGEILLEDARQILAAVDRARQNLLRSASGRMGKLRIAVCDGIAHWRVSKLVDEARKANPDIDVRIVHEGPLAQSRALCIGALDVGFCLAANNDPQLLCVPLWNDGVVAVMRTDHPLAKESIIQAITGECGTLIVPGEQYEHRSGAGVSPQWFSISEHQLPVEYVSSIELLLTLVAAGYGVGLVGAEVASQTHRPGLVVRPVGVRGAIFTTFLVLKRSNQSALVRQFAERARGLVV